jgi:predicted permease
MRQLLTESTLLAVAGGALGVALAAVCVRSVGSVAPVTLPRLDRIGIDRWVLAFALGLSLVTGVVFGLLPAVRGSRLRLRDALASDARTAVGGGSGRVRALLVVADLALSLVLLTGAALMLQSVRAMMRADPGFNADGVVTAQFSLVGTAYREDAAVLAFQNRLLERISALPGVEAAALAGQVPMGKNYDTWGFHIEGLMSANAADDPSVQRYSVSPDYFKALRIPLRRGRLLSTSDTTNSLPVVVVSESTAALWPGGEPLGRRVRIGGPSAPWRTVVGVVADVRHASLDEGVSTGMYVPQAQITDSYLVLAVRTRTTHPERLIPEIRAALGALDPTVPVYDIARLDELVAASFADRRFVMQLLSAFSTLALLLAAIGVYGVVSYSVSRRTRELGLRVALGARNADIVRLVLSGGAGTLAAGIGLGMAGAFATTRVLNAMLFGVSANDPAAMITSTIMLVGVTLSAHWLPVSRALRIDPSEALRQD